MKNISVVFFGTHAFATVILQGLIDAPNIDVQLVVTRPDKPVGRKKELQAPPVKILAEKHGLAVVQPKSLKNFQFSEFLNVQNVDMGVTAQYGLLIPKHVLDFPKRGVLNVHTSLLPKYRGASPIQSALIHGDEQTGVTIMKMDVGLDTGPILLQGKVDIDQDDMYLDLDKKMAPVGSELLLRAIDGYIHGTIAPAEQDESQVTTCRQFTREDGLVDWNKSAREIYNQYRGLTPWPGIYTRWQGKRLKLLAVRPSQESAEQKLIQKVGEEVVIGCGEGSLVLKEVQLEGKKAMDIDTFCNGFRVFIDSSVE